MTKIEFVLKIDGKEVKAIKEVGESWLTHNMIQTLCHVSPKFNELYRKWESPCQGVTVEEVEITNLRMENELRRLVNNGQW